MTRILPVEREAATPAMQRAYDEQVAAHGRVTNMKRTLGHSPVAFRALMEWYPLRDELIPVLGERLTELFAHAISSQTDCLICSTFFRRILVERGEDPDRLELDERERTIVEYGRRLAVDSNHVDDDLFGRLSRFLGPAEIVTLTAFGGVMIATNVFNNALQVDLDEYLKPYRRSGT